METIDKKHPEQLHKSWDENCIQWLVSMGCSRNVITSQTQKTLVKAAWVKHVLILYILQVWMNNCGMKSDEKDNF